LPRPGPIQLALGQKRQAVTWTLSALPPKADMDRRDGNVRFVPIASECAVAKKHRYSITSLGF
jgi:hypothetical protein